MSKKNLLLCISVEKGSNEGVMIDLYWEERADVVGAGRRAWCNDGRSCAIAWSSEREPTEEGVNV